jgi:hypothetical protein
MYRFCNVGWDRVVVVVAIFAREWDSLGTVRHGIKPCEYASRICQTSTPFVVEVRDGFGGYYGEGFGRPDNKFAQLNFFLPLIYVTVSFGARMYGYHSWNTCYCTNTPGVIVGFAVNHVTTLLAICTCELALGLIFLTLRHGGQNHSYRHRGLKPLQTKEVCSRMQKSECSSCADVIN